MAEPLSSLISLTIYDTTPVTASADPGDDWIRFSVGLDGISARSNAELTFTRDALVEFMKQGAEKLSVLDLPAPDDD